MAVAFSNRECVREETFKLVWPRPITFDEFLDLFMGREDLVELVDGAVVERPMVQYDHERLLMWLFHVVGIYAEEKSLGVVLGSRTAVQITPFRGRLPDLLFVRQERVEIIGQKALYDAPDLVLEITSPGDRRSDVIALETDYRTIGVAEIVFIDQRKQRVRLLRKRGDGYEENEIMTGTVCFETLPGFQIEVDWLFDEPRPAVRGLLDRLLTGEGA